MDLKRLKRRLRCLAARVPLSGRPMVIARYVAHHRRIPNLIRPTRFTEHVLSRIVLDRRPFLALMADKYAIRDYVREQVGEAFLPALLHVTTDPATIDFEALPDSFVVKPSHGSGWVRVIRDKRTLDREDLVRTCREWLTLDYSKVTGEWAYRSVPPRILVEERIDDGSGLAPTDYKLFVFGGRVRYVLAIRGRFEETIYAMMTPDWEPVGMHYLGLGRRVALAAPLHLSRMILAAERLSGGIDFVRVDFYDTAEKLFFGEMTATPSCGLTRYDPDSFDAELGELWKAHERPRADRARFSPGSAVGLLRHP